MIRGLLRFLWGGLRRLLKVMMWLVVAYPFLLVLMYYTTDVFFPNGAELNRNIDWSKWSRGDMYVGLRLIARNVDELCWNEFAVSGRGEPEGFIWLGGDHEVIYWSDPRYMAAIEESGLGGPFEPCQGFYDFRMGSRMLLGRGLPIRPRQ